MWIVDDVLFSMFTQRSRKFNWYYWFELLRIEGRNKKSTINKFKIHEITMRTIAMN